MKSDFERQESLACLGERLSKLRINQGEGQAALAEHLNTGVPSVSRLECGGTNPGWLTVERYLDYLGYKIEFVKKQEHDSDVR